MDQPRCGTAHPASTVKLDYFLRVDERPCAFDGRVDHGAKLDVVFLQLELPRVMRDVEQVVSSSAM